MKGLVFGVAIITDRFSSECIYQEARTKGVSLAMLGTSSEWNSEAILLACKRFGEKHHIKHVPVIVGVTGSYRYMAQSMRSTYSHDLKTGFKMLMNDLYLLAGDKESPYYDILVLPQLDHGDPVKDKWIFTEGIEYLSAVMFDCQSYPYGENLDMTRAYVEEYGGRVMIEAAIEEVSVEGGHGGAYDCNKNDGQYIKRAADYVKRTGIDFLVADLGTEQQSSSRTSRYFGDRARSLTQALGKKMLVLHGASALQEDRLSEVADDGILKVNMWTRIARESGKYAAHKIAERMAAIEKNDFEAAESRHYMNDNLEYAVGIMEKLLGDLKYDRFA
ncbi:MAG: class II fructose-bisphosphate aldolase [Clostridiaceae bacterium]